MRNVRVIISGGGTGGHIFPAIAIANALKAINSDIKILFVGAEGKMEMEKVPAAGYEIKGLWISGLQRKLTLQNLSFPFKLISSLWKAKRIMKEFKPDAAVGVGGFASGPMLQVAASNGIPALIQEQNSFPGITNKLLAGKVKKICVAYDGMDRFFPKDKIIRTGNPVRKEVVQLEGKKTRGEPFFGLESNKPTLLIVGGSLGARSINNGIKASLKSLLDAGIQLIWQTGKPDFETIKEFVGNKEEVKVHDFITKMDLAYACADLVVSRAGAMAVSELCLIQKPVVLVPYPYAAEDHQTKNAMALVNNNAAVLIADENTEKEIGSKVLELINDKNKRDEMSRNIGGLAYNDAADIIANEILKMIKK